MFNISKDKYYFQIKNKLIIINLLKNTMILPKYVKVSQTSNDLI